jgi:hypothetical protein
VNHASNQPLHLTGKRGAGAVGEGQAAADAGAEVEGQQRLARAGVALEQGEVVGAEVGGPQPGGGPGQEVAGALEGGAGGGEGRVHGRAVAGLGPATRGWAYSTLGCRCTLNQGAGGAWR